MIVLLPLLCLPLGLAGCIIAAFVGLITDQILLMVYCAQTTVSLLRGKLDWARRPKFFFDYSAVAETALLFLALNLQQFGFSDLVLLRQWLDERAKHFWIFKSQHSRICYEISAITELLNMTALADIIRQSKTREPLFNKAVQIVSRLNIGIDQSGLDWLSRLGLLLNWPPELLAVGFWENAQLNQDAMDLIPALKGKRICDRDELLRHCATIASEQTPELVEGTRMAYKILENQMDMIDRAIVEYARVWQAKPLDYA